jgi:Undecaprenyl-phosphate glucose phosphotransferase
MRAERLDWAEMAHPSGADGVRSIPSSVEDVANLPARPISRRSRSRFAHRSSLSHFARAIDALITVFVVFGLAYSARIDMWGAPLAVAVPYLLAPPMAIAGVWLAGGYRFRYAGSVTEHLARVAFGASVMLILLYTAVVALGASDPGVFARIAAGNALALFGLHANYIAITRALTRAGQLSDNVVIVGATQAAARIVSRNAREREINILGYFDDRAGRVATSMGDAPCLGRIDDLLVWDRLPEVDRIVVTVTSTAQERVRHLIDRLRSLPQEIILVLDLDGFSPETTSLARVVDAPAAYVSGAPRDARRAAVKRLFDVVVAVGAGVCFAPALVVIAALIRLDSPGPVFFRQKRHGFNNEIIRVWKFRTMRPDKDAEDGIIRQTVADDPRVTRIGGFLRAASLDELPQLLNVLTGEMSIVGPRPHAIGMTAGSMEVTRAVGDYAHRHRMKPGITGWAQINGSRGPVHTPDEVRERVRLDMHYVRHASVWLDAWIVLATVPRLLGDRHRCR